MNVLKTDHLSYLYCQVLQVSLSTITNVLLRSARMAIGGCRAGKPKLSVVAQAQRELRNRSQLTVNNFLWNVDGSVGPFRYGIL